MNRNVGIGILIFCFGFSNINLGWAVETMEVAPVVVQPYEIQELNQQMIDRDRQNRDEEFAIKQLIENNDQLTRSTLAHEQDEGLAKINQTMLSYRDALLSRDRARIVANGQRAWSSRYGDLIALTEDADAITVHQDLEDKSGMLAEKYQMLTQLKDEMTALNEKLSAKSQDAFNQKEATIDGFKKIAQEQADKMQLLTQRLDEMDQRIAKYDQIIAQKDEQIARLKENLSIVQSNVSLKDETIKAQEDQIALLQRQAEILSHHQQRRVPDNRALLIAKDRVIKEKQAQVDLLKSELEDKITQENNQSQGKPIQHNQNDQDEMIIKQQEEQIANLKAQKFAIIKEQESQVAALKAQSQDKIADENNQTQKDTIIKEQESQIASLKAQSQELSSKEELIKAQADQMDKASEQFKNQSVVYADVKAQVMSLRNKMQRQAIDLKAKNRSIRWLKQVLTVAENKAKYYQLSSQIDQLPMKQVQEEVQTIKDDFTKNFKDYDQFENAIVSLKDQVSRISLQLSKKQGQVNLLKSELENKITEAKHQGLQDAHIQQDLKEQLQDRENQIVRMKTDILTILQTQANQEIYRRHAKDQVDDRVKLAQQLIDLQQQETALLEEKNNLAVTQNDLFDQHALALENKIKGFLTQHQIQTVDLENRMQELRGELDQKEQQVQSLDVELRNKIAQEKNQAVVTAQIHDLQGQLQDETSQIATMKTRLQEGQQTQEEVGSLKQQLAAAQDRANELKQQLDSRTAQSNQMTMMMGDYQKKLESKDSAYNAQSGQITALNSKVQEKEAQIAQIKKDMEDLQGLTDAQNRDIQTKDLSLSMVQQKVMDEKINEYQDRVNALQVTSARQLQEITSLRTDLALARQQLEGMPSSDEIDFLRTGLKKATAQLNQKNEMLSQIKANADEYKKEFDEQTREFKSLKDQLLDAQQEIQRKDEDLKYKDMAITRLKERSRGLNPQMNIVQSNQLKSSDNNGTLEEKLKQALVKIDEQGRMINVLVQKLQEDGQTVDLSKIAGNQ